MSDLKIFEVEEMYWVLTTTPEKAIEILFDDDLIDDKDIDNYIVKECNYKDGTCQPLSVLKNIFTQKELWEIEYQLKNYTDYYTKERDGIKYHFEDMRDRFDYIGVNLTFGEILNNPKILSEFEIDSVISTTEY
jgi:hypothetical protein